MKNYNIHRAGKEGGLGKVTVMVTSPSTLGTSQYELEPMESQKVYNHSPDGFEFGFGGSGPAQLALAILLDFTDDVSLSMRLYQDFKWAFIGRIKHPGTTIHGCEITDWILNYQRTKEEK